MLVFHNDSIGLYFIRHRSG